MCLHGIQLFLGVHNTRVGKLTYRHGLGRWRGTFVGHKDLILSVRKIADHSLHLSALSGDGSPLHVLVRGVRVAVYGIPGQSYLVSFCLLDHFQKILTRHILKDKFVGVSVCGGAVQPVSHAHRDC